MQEWAIAVVAVGAAAALAGIFVLLASLLRRKRSEREEPLLGGAHGQPTLFWPIAGAVLLVLGLTAVGVAVGLTMTANNGIVVRLDAGEDGSSVERAGGRRPWIRGTSRGRFSRAALRTDIGATSVFVLPKETLRLVTATYDQDAVAGTHSWTGTDGSFVTTSADGDVSGQLLSVAFPGTTYQLSGSLNRLEVETLDTNAMPASDPVPIAPVQPSSSVAPSADAVTRATVVPRITVGIVFNKATCTTADATQATSYRTKLRGSSWGKMDARLLDVVWTCVAFTTKTTGSGALADFSANTAVKNWRTLVGADVISGIAQLTDSCGIGHRPTLPVLAGHKGMLWTVVDPDCVAGHSLEHELGHNFGMQHNRLTTGSACCTNPTGSTCTGCNYGFMNARYRTIMSYPASSSCGTEAAFTAAVRVPVYSGYSYTNAAGVTSVLGVDCTLAEPRWNRIPFLDGWPTITAFYAYRAPVCSTTKCS